ncbi:uncharacterized protein [Rutidosis leptorrhynchoides]|uniref:uncharacterized protein n=1 Tax=Rutidosis leptorrhynchoides TaxID=125765 RepID=UPI003A99ADFE
MSRSQGKRKRSDSEVTSDSLTGHEQTLYNIIRSKENNGIWARDLNREAKLSGNVVKKPIQSLLSNKLIKEVTHFEKKGKHYMAVEFEPSDELTGGAWYTDGSLDMDLITDLKEKVFPQIMRKLKVATLEEIVDGINRSQVCNVTLAKKQVEEILKALVLDNVILEVKSNGSGEFSSIPVGKTCYKTVLKKRSEPVIGAMASIPCGVCIQISRCTPDGIISPNTCVYYTKWLDF